jgi:hypothetical protein
MDKKKENHDRGTEDIGEVQHCQAFLYFQQSCIKLSLFSTTKWHTSHKKNNKLLPADYYYGRTSIQGRRKSKNNSLVLLVLLLLSFSSSCSSCAGGGVGSTSLKPSWESVQHCNPFYLPEKMIPSALGYSICLVPLQLY